MHLPTYDQHLLVFRYVDNQVLLRDADTKVADMKDTIAALKHKVVELEAVVPKKASLRKISW